MAGWVLQWLSGLRTRLRQRRDLLPEFIVLHHQLAVLQPNGGHVAARVSHCSGCSCRGPNFAKLISTLAFGGIVYIYGLLSTGVTALPVLEMIAKVITVKAHNIWLTSGDATRRNAAVEFVLKGLETGALKPVIDRLFTFDEMVDVHRYLEQSGQFGKIVVTL